MMTIPSGLTLLQLKEHGETALYEAAAGRVWSRGLDMSYVCDLSPQEADAWTCGVFNAASSRTVKVVLPDGITWEFRRENAGWGRVGRIDVNPEEIR